MIYQKWVKTSDNTYDVLYQDQKVGSISKEKMTYGYYFFFISIDGSFKKNHYHDSYLRTSINRWAPRYLLEKQLKSA